MIIYMTEKYIIVCSLKGTEYICATFKIEMLKTFSLEFVVFMLLSSPGEELIIFM